jgi:hypothetical protein
MNISEQVGRATGLCIASPPSLARARPAHPSSPFPTSVDFTPARWSCGAPQFKAATDAASEFAGHYLDYAALEQILHQM